MWMNMIKIYRMHVGNSQRIRLKYVFIIFILFKVFMSYILFIIPYPTPSMLLTHPISYAFSLIKTTPTAKTATTKHEICFVLAKYS